MFFDKEPFNKLFTDGGLTREVFFDILIKNYKYLPKEVCLVKIQESAENYLETVFVLKNKNGNVRSIDVATELGFTKPSVSIAVKNLRESGYITVSDDGFLSLTEKGLEVAQSVYERHNVIAKALIKLGVDEETAYEDSCKIEHHISSKSIQKIKEYLENLK